MSQRRLICLLTLCVLGPTLVGCGSSAVKPMKEPQIVADAAANGVADVIIPFSLTPEMVEWLEEHVPRALSEDRRMHVLIQSLLDPKSLAIQYRKHDTSTAAEVFNTGYANCLSFTNLFIGMARELDLRVYFLEVRDIEHFSREGDLVVISDHIAVGHGPSHNLMIIDFADQPGTQYRRIRPITDVTAIAMFYSNRGAEELRHGEMEAAVSWLRQAVKIDDNLAAAWVNLGVALRRSGDRGGAKFAYRKALEVDSNTTSAYHNLAAVLRLEGNDEEAMELLALTDRGGNRNPFSYLALGDLSLRHGRFGEAERFYRKAARLDNETAEPLAALGLMELAAGHPAEARQWLKKARRVDPDEARAVTLAGRLDPESRH